MNATVTETQCKIERSLFIEARLWFDKSGGNTYFTARVFLDGKWAFTLPFQYGYDTQYLYAVGRELVERGYLPEEYEDRPLWNVKQEFGLDFYHVHYYVGKRELFKD